VAAISGRKRIFRRAGLRAKYTIVNLTTFTPRTKKIMHLESSFFRVRRRRVWRGWERILGGRRPLPPVINFGPAQESRKSLVLREFFGFCESGHTPPIRDNDWTRLLGWPGLASIEGLPSSASMSAPGG
jgi:hypothetical protein